MTQPHDPYAGYPGYSGHQPPTPHMIPPGPPRRLDAVESLSQGWKALSSNLLPWVLSMLVFLALIGIIIAVGVIPIALSETVSEDQAVALAPATVAALIIAYLIAFAIGMVWTLNVYRNAVRQVQGETVTLGSFFQLRELGIPFVAYLIMGLAVTVGMVLLILPGLALAVLLMFVPYLAFSRPETGLSGIFRGSLDIVKNNLGASLLLILFTLLLSAVGSLTVIGVFITQPLTAVMMAHAAVQGTGDRVVYRP
ncbi:MAG: hypothetical protein Q4G50_03290 [Corynebacterium sp.]|uniref:hypothetical protein n=1 Tax=Corynebacterium sp. TaxID=1720 RepID=UPI0026E079CC|nr:hypothetical protein [Corynebacterium sp.]MDO5669008.1 hypothetical protein [Corynebacterium sp.]